MWNITDVAKRSFLKPQSYAWYVHFKPLLTNEWDISGIWAVSFDSFGHKSWTILMSSMNNAFLYLTAEYNACNKCASYLSVFL